MPHTPVLSNGLGRERVLTSTSIQHPSSTLPVRVLPPEYGKTSSLAFRVTGSPLAWSYGTQPEIGRPLWWLTVAVIAAKSVVDIGNPMKVDTY